MAKVVVKALLITAMLLCALPSSASPFADLKTALKKPIAALILDTINSQFNGKFKAQTIQFSPPSAIVMTGVTLVGEGKDVIIEAGKVEATLSVAALLLGEIRVTSAVVTNPTVYLQIKDGVLNIEHAFAGSTLPSGEKQKAPLVNINGIHVQNASFRFDIEKDVQIISNTVDVFAKISIVNGDFNLDASSTISKTGFVLAGDVKIPYTDFLAKNVTIKNDILAIESATAQAMNSPFFAAGIIDLGKERYDLKATLDAKPDTWPLGVKKPTFQIPSYKAQVSMNGKLTKPEISGKFDFKKTDFLGATIESAHIEAFLDPQHLAIKNGTIRFADQSLLMPTGSLDFDTKHLQLSGEFSRLQLATIEHLFDTSLGAKGETTGKASIKGTLQKNAPLKISISGKLIGAQLNPVKIPDDTSLKLEMKWTPDIALHISTAALNGPGLSAKATGHLDLKKETLAFHYDAQAADPSRLWSKRPPDVFAKRLRAHGRLWGSFNLPELSARAQLDELSTFGFRSENLTFDLLGNAKRFEIKNLTAAMEHGTLNGNLTLPLEDNQPIKGFIDIRNANVTNPFAKILPIPVESSFVSAQIYFSGTLQSPAASGALLLHTTRTAGFFIRTISSQFQYHDHAIFLKNLTIDGPQGKAFAEQFRFDLGTRKLKGLLDVEFFDIMGLPALAKWNISGILRGPIEFGGSFDHPEFEARFRGDNLRVLDAPLGSGPVFASLSHSLLSLSVSLSDESSSIDTRASISFEEKKVNAILKFQSADLSVLTAQIPGLLMPVRGQFSGTAQVEGALEEPKISFLFSVPDLQYKAQTREPTWQSAGRLTLSSQWEHGELLAKICGLPKEPSENQGCSPDDTLSFDISGRFRAMDNFSLDVKGDLERDHLEQFFRVLNDQSISTDVALSLAANFSKKPGETLKISGDFDLNQLAVRLPGVPTLQVKKPIFIAMSPTGVRLKQPAFITLGDEEMTIKGAIGDDRVDLYLKGQIPLLFVKLFTSAIVSAEGTANGELEITGSRKAPLIKGFIIPKPGSSLMPRTGLETIEFHSGGLFFESLSGRNGMMSIKADKLNLAVGAGNAQLDGTVILELTKESSLVPTHWDLKLTGENILVQGVQNWVEADFDLKLQTIQDADWLWGQITLADGIYIQEFSLQNFILSFDGSPFATTQLLPKWLSSLQLNIDLAVQSFAIQAGSAAFLANFSLAADFNLTGTVAAPRLVGALDILEGQIKFPAATFEIASTTIPFLNTPGKPIDPRIDITATTVLQKQRFNLSEDTTVECQLKGSLEHLNFDLKATGDKSKDRLDLLLMLIGPSFSSTDVTDQVQQFARPLAGSQFRIGSTFQAQGLTTYLQWQLSPRIDIEGSTAVGAQALKLQNLKLRFLLFDHLPAGKMLFFEGEFLAPSDLSPTGPNEGRLRLKYRIIGQ